MSTNQPTDNKRLSGIISTTKKNPLLGIILMLLIGISTLAGTVSYLYIRQSSVYTKSEEKYINRINLLENKVDALTTSLTTQQKDCQTQITQMLQKANEELQNRIATQEKVNERFDLTIDRNNQIIKSLKK